MLVCCFLIGGDVQHVVGIRKGCVFWCGVVPHIGSLVLLRVQIFCNICLRVCVWCKWDNWVELHQNPSYKCINRGLAKWALATLELIHGMRVVVTLNVRRGPGANSTVSSPGEVSG